MEDNVAPSGKNDKMSDSPISGDALGLTELASGYMESLLRGDRQKASAMILKAVDQGLSVRDVYLGVFQPVQREIGRLWQTNLVSVAVEHFCTAATQMIMSQLFPLILTKAKNGLSLVGCCVGEELHELGLRMVCDFFEMDGWETYYMGANCPADAVLSALEDRSANILCLSVTIPHNLGQARDLIRDVTSKFPRTKVLVGGFPFVLNPKLGESLGAHGSARDAAEATALAIALTNMTR